MKTRMSGPRITHIFSGKILSSEAVELRAELERARAEEARLLGEAKAKDERIKALEAALTGLAPHRDRDGAPCWCMDPNEASLTGHGKDCGGLRALLAKVSP